MYEWLKDYQRLVQEIDYMEFNEYQTAQELDRWVNGDLAKVKITADSDGAKVEERLEAIRNELLHKRKKLNMLKDLIASFDGLENNILRLKYIEGMTLEQVADELNFSVGHINRKHQEVMKMMKYAEKRKLDLI